MLAKQAISFVLASLVAVGFVVSVRAADYPTRPITIIVPFSAGGPTDVVARIVADHMANTLGQPIRIENIAGAGGSRGTVHAKNAVPDGYTLTMGHTGTHAIAVSLYPHLGYAPVKDFAPIGLVTGMPIMIVARVDYPGQNLQEFIQHLKANEHTVKAGHAGRGSVSHASCSLFNAMIKITPAAVPFDSTGSAMQALLRGQIDYMCDQLINLAAQVEAGAVRAFVVAAPDRNPALPRVPAAHEAGLPDFHISVWNALFAPAGTLQPILDKLTNALDKALDNPRIRRQLLALGCEVPGGRRRGQQPLADLVTIEIARWAVLKSTPWAN